MAYPKNTLETFWSRVAKTSGCWEYRGPREDCDNPDTYPLFRYEGEYWTVSRLVWVLTFGEIREGLFVCHKCDNPRCVRPDHLFLGTIDDNNKDKARKGRARSGAEKLRRLTDEQIEQAFTEYLKGGVSMSSLAQKYGISQSKLTKWFGRLYRKYNLVNPFPSRGGGKRRQGQTGITLPR